MTPNEFTRVKRLAGVWGVIASAGILAHGCFNAARADDDRAPAPAPPIPRALPAAGFAGPPTDAPDAPAAKVATTVPQVAPGGITVANCTGPVYLFSSPAPGSQQQMAANTPVQQQQPQQQQQAPAIQLNPLPPIQVGAVAPLYQQLQPVQYAALQPAYAAAPARVKPFAYSRNAISNACKLVKLGVAVGTAVGLQPVQAQGGGFAGPASYAQVGVQQQAGAYQLVHVGSTQVSTVQVQHTYQPVAAPAQAPVQVVMQQAPQPPPVQASPQQSAPRKGLFGFGR